MLAPFIALWFQTQAVVSGTHDRVIQIDARASDASPILGSRWGRVSHTSTFSGTLHVWTEVEGALDTLLRIEDAHGRAIAEDDDSGGKPTAYLALPVARGDELRVHVFVKSTAQEPAPVRLHLVGAVEDDATRETLRLADERLAKIAELRTARNDLAARSEVGALIDALVAAVDAGTGVPGRVLLAAGREAQAMNQYRPAERALSLALAECSRTLPPDHAELQAVRAALALAVKELGDARRARELEESLLASRERTLPADHDDIQRARVNLAVSLSAAGDDAGARALYQQVLDVFARTKADDDRMVQIVRINLGVALMHSSEFEAARTVYESARAALGRSSTPDEHLVRLVEINLSDARVRLGDVRGARETLESVIQRFGSTLPEDHPHMRLAKRNLGSVLNDLGEFQPARELLERLLEIETKSLPDDHSNLIDTLFCLARSLKELGDFAAARPIEERILTVRSKRLPDDDRSVQDARINLGNTLAELGEQESALALFQKVHEVRSRLLPPDHPDLQNARMCLATALANSGDLVGARALHEAALEAWEKTLPDDHPSLQLVRLNLGLTLRDLGEVDAAVALLEQVLATRIRLYGDEHPDVLMVRFHLATTVGSSGDLARARDISRSMASSLSRVFAALLLEASPREAEERWRRNAGHLSHVLSLAGAIGDVAADPALTREVIEVVECVRGIALEAARLASVADADPELHALHAQVRDAARDLAALARRHTEGRELDRAIERRDDAQRALLRELAAAPGARASFESPSVSTLARSLSETDAIVSYWRYSRWTPGAGATSSVVAFVIRDRGEPARFELGPAADIERAIAAWRGSLGVSEGARGVGAGAPARSSARELGEALRRAVLDPLAPALAGAQRWIIAPDDALHTIAFDALPATEGFVGDRARIDVVLTLRDRVFARTRVDGERTLVALGAGDFDAGPGPDSVPAPPPGASSAAAVAHPPDLVDGSPLLARLRGSGWSTSFGPLKATRAEVDGIGELFTAQVGGSVRLLTGAQASRGSIEDTATRASYLHIATHGWFAPDSISSSAELDTIDERTGIVRGRSRAEDVARMSPMVLCGLAFAGANRAFDDAANFDGLITAEEIAGWDLSRCELAVLSACDTNVGERRAGQGVASLQKALQMAGARSVITSLWKVPDEATKELMLDFYRRLWVAKRPKWQALWEAKTKLREAQDERGVPLYTTRDWAAWVLTGAPD